MKVSLNEIKEKYLSYTILLFCIIILFVACSYSGKVQEYELYFGGKPIITRLQEKIINIENKKYIYIEDLTRVFPDNFYYDKISGKLIVTSNSTLEKISRNDEEYFLQYNSKLFVNLEKIINITDKNIAIQGENIYIDDFEYIEGVINKNRVEVFIEDKIVAHLNKNTAVKIRVDDNLKSNTGILNIIVSNGNENYYGKVIENNVNFEYIASNEQEKNKVIITKVEGNTYNKNLNYVDYVSANMLRLSGVDKVYELDYTIPKIDAKVFASINNGYNSSNYDVDIVSGMLHSETNRQAVITSLLEFVNKNNFAGIAIDFANFKSTDKILFTQFIKELSAVMHFNNKLILVNVPSTGYIDVESISNVVDFVVIQAYYERTTASKTSGPVASLSYVEKLIQNLKSAGAKVGKLILEIPAYTILWTERQGTVIDAAIYDMNLSKEYIKQNNIETKVDKNAAQNYISFTKGITTYKMWLEDEYSIEQKVNLVNEYSLAGVSIYKSGMELSGIYDIISSKLNK